MDNGAREMLLAMAHSPILNYVTPGLTSSLIGGDGHGKVRLFESDRDTREWVTPHSHRFDFACVVLRGAVTNILYHVGYGNSYARGFLHAPKGGLGEYRYVPGDVACRYREEAKTYKQGDCYAMTHKEIHSIQFSNGAQVLFLEGPELTNQSVVLEPWSNGKRVPTFATHPWMFERSSLGKAGES